MNASKATEKIDATRICCATIFNRNTFWSSECKKPAKIEQGGKFYCGIHDPVRLKAAQAKRDAEYNVKMKVRLDKENSVRDKARKYDELISRYGEHIFVDLERIINGRPPSPPVMKEEGR